MKKLLVKRIINTTDILILLLFFNVSAGASSTDSDSENLVFKSKAGDMPQ